MKKTFAFITTYAKQALAIALLVAGTTVASAQTEPTAPQQSAAAQAGPSDELPAQMTMSQEEVMASARTTIQKVKEEAKATGQHSRKLERQLDKVAAELDNYEKSNTSVTQEKKGLAKVTTLPAQMLAKRALKKAEKSGVYDIKQAKSQKAAKALNTLATVGLVLTILGLVFLLVVNGLVGLLLLLTGLVLLLVGLLQ